jgi:hypothetical protein
MYYSVCVYHNSMAVHLTRSNSEGVLRSAVYPVQQMGLTMMICCGMVVRRVGMLGV